MAEAQHTIMPEPLQDFVARCFARVGMAPDDAALMADTLIQSDLRGVDSHGAVRLRPYIKRMRLGYTRVDSRPAVVREAPVTAVVDANGCSGQVVSAMAMDLAIGKAREYGMGAVAVRDSTHFGTAAYWALRAVPHGMVGFSVTNTSPVIAPWGARRPVLGNNPWCYAAPAGRYAPVVLDMANTVVARGRVRLARDEGNPIPQGWALDSEGRPTTDPVQALSGLLLPVGGYKGWGITFIMEVLAGVLTGSAMGPDVHHHDDPDRKQGVGHLMLALNVEHFLPLSEFTARMEELIDRCRAVETFPGTTRTYYPGEPEWEKAELRGRLGIPIPASTLEAIRQTALELGVPFTPEEWGPSMA